MNVKYIAFVTCKTNFHAPYMILITSKVLKYIIKGNTSYVTYTRIVLAKSYCQLTSEYFSL